TAAPTATTRIRAATPATWRSATPTASTRTATTPRSASSTGTATGTTARSASTGGRRGAEARPLEAARGPGAAGRMARLEGFEPPTNGFGSHYSIRLSYRRADRHFPPFGRFWRAPPRPPPFAGRGPGGVTMARSEERRVGGGGGGRAAERRE